MLLTIEGNHANEKSEQSMTTNLTAGRKAELAMRLEHCERVTLASLGGSVWIAFATERLSQYRGEIRVGVRLCRSMGLDAAKIRKAIITAKRDGRAMLARVEQKLASA